MGRSSTRCPHNDALVCDHLKDCNECPHNDALVCDHLKDCNECGWFPGVREKRLERIRKDRQIRRINLYAHVDREENIGIRRNKIK